MVILTALLQSVLGAQGHVLGVMPDLALMMSIVWTLQRGLGEGLAVALIGGLLTDILSATPFGLSTTTFLVTAIGAGVAQKNVFGGAWYLPYVTGLWAALLHNLLLVLVLELGGRPTFWAPLLGRVILPVVIVDTLAMVPIYLIIRRLLERANPPVVGWQ